MAQSDETATRTDSHKQTTYYLKTITNIACVTGVNRELVGFGGRKTRGIRVGSSTLTL